MHETLGRVVDYIARNRRWLGGLALALWAPMQADPWLIERPRLNAYMGAGIAYVLGAGAHKSDRQHREEQGRLSIEGRR